MSTLVQCISALRLSLDKDMELPINLPFSLKRVEVTDSKISSNICSAYVHGLLCFNMESMLKMDFLEELKS